MRSLRRDTRLIEAGRKPRENFGIVNPPVYHCSTVLYPTLEALEARARNPLEGVRYGLSGTPTTFAFEEGVAALEGAERAIALPSGLAAIAAAVLPFIASGDHLLVTDNVYQPTRRLCDTLLAGFGVETTYFDPMIGAGIEALMRPRTRILFVEAPGSLTFEVQDIPAIAEVAHRRGVLVAMDNTWSAGLYYDAFAHGVDLSIQAATKYIAGHSDAMLGTVAMRDRALWEKVKVGVGTLGYGTGPDDCYLGLRGLRSMSARLARHQASGAKVAEWVAARPEVVRLLHPAYPSCPGHAIWRRDFTGASSLFGFVLPDVPRPALAAMLDGMRLFAMGYSWGGFESLIVPYFAADLRRNRPASGWPYEGPLLRLHVGLEDPDDLIADLDDGLRRLNAAL